MNRIQTACFFLIASAFVLSAILVVRLEEKAPANTAHADGQVIAQPAFTMMTARTRGQQGNNAEESLFILDNNGGRLVVYVPDVANDKLEPIATIKMSSLFGGRGGGGGGR